MCKSKKIWCEKLLNNIWLITNNYSVCNSQIVGYHVMELKNIFRLENLVVEAKIKNIAAFYFCISFFFYT